MIVLEALYVIEPSVYHLHKTDGSITYNNVKPYSYEVAYTFFGQKAITIRKMWEVLNNKGFVGRFIALKFIYSYADTPELPNVNSAGATIFCYVSSYTVWQVFNGIIVDPNNKVYNFTCVNNDSIGTDDGLIMQI